MTTPNGWACVEGGEEREPGTPPPADAPPLGDPTNPADIKEPDPALLEVEDEDEDLEDDDDLEENGEEEDDDDA